MTCVFVLAYLKHHDSFLSQHTVVWGIFSLLCFCLFVCTVTDFSATEKDSGMKLCTLVRLLSSTSSSHFGALWLAWSHGAA